MLYQFNSCCDSGFSTVRRLSIQRAFPTGYSPGRWLSTEWLHSDCRINRGRKDGVVQDAPVINENGVVGRAIDVTRASAKVLLISDPNSSIGGLNEKSRDLGVVVGGGLENLKMKYVVPSAKIEVGDVILTSGIGGIFPKGIPIGKVKKVQMRDYDIFKQVEIEPVVDFSKLEDLFVVIK